MGDIWWHSASLQSTSIFLPSVKFGSEQKKYLLVTHRYAFNYKRKIAKKNAKKRLQTVVRFQKQTIAPERYFLFCSAKCVSYVLFMRVSMFEMYIRNIAIGFFYLLCNEHVYAFTCCNGSMLIQQ